MKKPIICSCITAMVLGGTPVTHARDEETRLERVIVTASRVAEWATRRAASTTVIDREQLELQNARDLAEVLRFSAGLDIGRNGGPGQTASVFVRGAESNHVLLLVDGVRINPGTIGVPAIQNIDPDLIDRIEIVKGPRSTVYGSDAIGGVVNVITRRDTAPKQLQVSVGGGSFDTQDVSARVGIGNRELGANFALSYYDTEGFPTRAAALEDHGHDNFSVNVSLWQTRDNHRFEVDMWRSSGNTEYADFLLNTADQDHTNQTLKARLITELRPHWESAVTVAHATDDIQQNQPGFTGDADFLTTERISFDWQNTLLDARQNRLILGLYAFDEAVDVLSFGSPFDEDTNVVAGYAEYGVQGERLDASLAARYTHHDDFGAATTWHADMTYRLNSQLQLILAAGSGFRAPDATDRFGFGGNPDLDPEESVTFELGARLRLSDRHSVALRAFEQKIDNLINYVVTDFVTFEGINLNVDRTRTTGIELSHKWIGERLRIETDLIVQDPKDETTDLLLLRRAEQSLTTNAYYTLGRGTLGLNVLATGKRADIDANTFLRIESPGYVLGNLSYSYRFSDKWTVRASVDNVLDTDYQTAHGFNTAERSFYLKFNYDLALSR